MFPLAKEQDQTTWKWEWGFVGLSQDHGLADICHGPNDPPLVLFRWNALLFNSHFCHLAVAAGSHSAVGVSLVLRTVFVVVLQPAQEDQDTEEEEEEEKQAGPKTEGGKEGGDSESKPTEESKPAPKPPRKPRAMRYKVSLLDEEVYECELDVRARFLCFTVSVSVAV